MNLGNTSTRGEQPRKAFETVKGSHYKKINFGESSIGDGKVYRRRGAEKKNWFWITVKILVLAFILMWLVLAFIHG